MKIKSLVDLLTNYKYSYYRLGLKGWFSSNNFGPEGKYICHFPDIVYPIGGSFLEIQRNVYQVDGSFCDTGKSQMDLDTIGANVHLQKLFDMKF